MPLDLSDFPHEVLVAFFIFEFLEDKWEGMSGTYMGKSWSSIEYFFSLYQVQDATIVLFFMKLWEGILVEHRSKKADQKRKVEERKSSSGGKNFTHSVKG